MPVLENTRLELFCQERAKTGATDASAYTAAGYKAKNAARAVACASRMLGDAKVVARIAEIKAADLSANVMTRNEVLQELSLIASADITKVLKRSDPIMRVHKDEISGARKIVIEQNNKPRLVNLSELDRNTAAAIQAPQQYADGSFTVKFCSKLSALNLLGKHYGLFSERNADRDRPSHDDIGERLRNAERKIRETCDAEEREAKGPPDQFSH